LARANIANGDSEMTPALLCEVLASLGGMWSNIDNLDTSAAEVLHADVLGSVKSQSQGESEMSADSEEEDKERSLEMLTEWLGASNDAICTLALRVGALIGAWLAATADDAVCPMVFAVVEAMQRVGGPALKRLILNAQGVPPTHVAASSADGSALAIAIKLHHSMAFAVHRNGHNLLHAIFEPLPGTRLQESVARDSVLKAVEQGTPINAPALISGSTPLHLLAALGGERAPTGSENSGLTELLLSNAASPGCVNADVFFPFTSQHVLGHTLLPSWTL